MHLFSHKVNLSNLDHHTYIHYISASAKDTFGCNQLFSVQEQKLQCVEYLFL